MKLKEEERLRRNKTLKEIEAAAKAAKIQAEVEMKTKQAEDFKNRLQADNVLKIEKLKLKTQTLQWLQTRHKR